MAKFVYVKRSKEDIATRAAQKSYDKDELLQDVVKTWKPKDGDNLVRILPPSWEGARNYGVDVFVHYNIGAERNSYICPKAAGRGPCPFCEAQMEAMNNGDVVLSKSLKANKRVLVYMLDQNDPKSGVHAWLMAWTLDKELATQSIDKDTGDVLNIDDPDNGFNVTINRTGTGPTTKYVPVVSRRSSRIAITPEIETLLMEHPLPSLLNIFEYDYLAKKLMSHSISENDGGEGKKQDFDKSSLTWDSVHKLRGDRLDRLVADAKLPIKPELYNSDADLADAICDALRITPTSNKSSPPAPSKPTERQAAPWVEDEEYEQSTRRTASSASVADDGYEDPSEGTSTDDQDDESTEDSSSSGRPSAVDEMRKRLANLRNRGATK